MTDENSSRRIGGLEPRSAAPDLSRLIRRNRPEVSSQVEEVSDATQDGYDDTAAGEAPSSSPGNEKRPRRTVPEGIQSPQRAEPAVDSETKRMTVYIASRHYARARAAYRATSYAARDRSWSEFVEKALVAELERREAEYNAGTPYAPDSSPLAPGRPLSN
jgi:hypothetical protein